jgi:hypothetical protein
VKKCDLLKIKYNFIGILIGKCHWPVSCEREFSLLQLESLRSSPARQRHFSPLELGKIPFAKESRSHGKARAYIIQLKEKEKPFRILGGQIVAETFPGIFFAKCYALF